MTDHDPYGATQNVPGDADESLPDAATAEHPERIGRCNLGDGIING